MTLLEESCAAMAAHLEGIGLPYPTYDPTAVQLPGTLFLPVTITPLTLGSLQIEWDVYVIAPDTLNPLAHLAAAMEKAWPRIGRVETTAIDLGLNYSAEPLPALRFSIETTTTIGDNGNDVED